MHQNIVTVTLNPSIDVTLWADGLHPDKTNRVEAESREVGGKGINVSRVLHNFGVENICLAVAGEDNRDEFASFLEIEKLRYELLCIRGAVRENLTLRCGDQTVKFNRKGPALSAMMITALLALIKSRIHEGDIVVFAGSLPEDVAVQDYVELILAVKNAGARIVIDSDIFTLQHYRVLSPWLIKPNIHELMGIVEVGGTTITHVIDAAKKLQQEGVQNVLVSLGANGLACIGEQETVCVEVPRVDVKSTVGAGDSTLAGFLVGCTKQYALADSVRLAAACGTACVQQDGTGLAEKPLVKILLEQLKVV